MKSHHYTVEVTTVTTVDVTADSDDEAMKKACTASINETPDKCDAVITDEDGVSRPMASAKAEAHRRSIPVIPFRESLADRNCPVCGCGLSFDCLNDNPQDIPLFCQHCGQAIDWGAEYPDEYRESLRELPALKYPLTAAIRELVKTVYGFEWATVDTVMENLRSTLELEGTYMSMALLTKLRSELQMLETLKKFEEEFT